MDFCNQCYNTSQIPNSWHRANVTSVFKKGNVELCKNYRPISLEQMSYKIFASIVLTRMKKAGAENRLWKNQFGFRSKYGTNDALFIIRRKIDIAMQSKNDPLCILALDWAKAFDSVSPTCLCNALERFGIPGNTTKLINQIYTNRIFKVTMDNQSSDYYVQQFGISQGCPMSPFLFSIMMTVLLFDVHDNLPQQTRQQLDDLLYADDTLLFATKGEYIQTYMDKIAKKEKHTECN